MALVTIYGKTQHGKSRFVKEAIVCNYPYSIYVNPKFEKVPEHEGIFNWNYDPQDLLKHFKICIPKVNQWFFDFLRHMRTIIPINYPICVVLDELHRYQKDSQGIEDLATTSASLNIDVYVIVQSVTLIDSIWIKQADKRVFFYLEDEELNILKSSIYRLSIPTEQLKQLWSDNDPARNIKTYNFAIYDGYTWQYYRALGSQAPDLTEDPQPAPVEDIQDQDTQDNKQIFEVRTMDDLKQAKSQGIDFVMAICPKCSAGWTSIPANAEQIIKRGCLACSDWTPQIGMMQQ